MDGDGDEVLQIHNGLTKCEELDLKLNLISILNDQVSGKGVGTVLTTTNSDVLENNNTTKNGGNAVQRSKSSGGDLLGNIVKKKKEKSGSSW